MLDVFYRYNVVSILIRKVRRSIKFVRAALLRLRGVSVGRDTMISFGAWIDTAPKAKVTIGDNVIISHGAKVLAHDWAESRMGITDYVHHYKHTIIEDDVFVGMNVLVLPGVKVGAGSILAAGAIVTRDVASMTVVAGNPAKVISRYCTKTNTWARVK